MAIRLRDIANDLNLSTMTISKVLRGQTDVSVETKARVLKRVQELNYRPNASARGLRTGQTYCVGMVVPTLDGAPTPEIVSGANEILRAEGYSVVLSSADGDIDSEEKEAELHLSRQVDVLLFFLREDASDLPLTMKNASTPIVLLGHPLPNASAPSVSVNDIEVGRIATRYLLERGAKRIAYLRGPRTATADLRFKGFLEAMRSASIPVRREWILELQTGEYEYRNALTGISKLLAKRSRPDGVVAYTDLAAAGARDAAMEAHLSVPDQFQVIGSGNQIAVCQIGISLTSVDLGFREVGRRAARLALKLIEKNKPETLRSANVTPTVIERASTRE